VLHSYQLSANAKKREKKRQKAAAAAKSTNGMFDIDWIQNNKIHS